MVLILGCFAVAVALAIPPWKWERADAAATAEAWSRVPTDGVSAGYAFLFSPPVKTDADPNDVLAGMAGVPEQVLGYGIIDWERLGLTVGAIIFATGALVMGLKG